MYSGLLKAFRLILFTFTLLIFNNPLLAQDAEQDVKENVEEVKKEVQQTEEKKEPEKSLLSKINSAIEDTLFFDIAGGSIQVDNVDINGNPVDPKVPKKQVKLYFLVVFLAVGAIFFTFFYRFINFTMLKHSVDVIRGKYDNPEDKGEISHFKALTSALSATIGLGNIAGHQARRLHMADGGRWGAVCAGG